MKVHHRLNRPQSGLLMILVACRPADAAMMVAQEPSRSAALNVSSLFLPAPKIVLSVARATHRAR